ncbi:MAG: response regulator [Nannocystaceae bacterium]|nr:response regulator [Nannocystaceae bacterium]
MTLSGARIIVVDDQADLADNLQELLEIDGADVRLANTAKQGLQLAAEGFDVALVDVRLPDSTGLALVPQLHALDAASAVVLITGHASIDDAILAVREGAYAYVLKPFDSHELYNTVSRAYEQVQLGRRAARLQRELERREAELSTMVDTVAALLLVLDEEGVVIHANPAVSAVTQAPLQDLVGRRWADEFVPPGDRQAMLQAYRELHAGQLGVSFEGRVLRRGRVVEERVIRWRLAAATAETGFRIYASGLDLTEVRTLERRTALAEKLAAVGTVSAGLAHEIRNPLNAATLQLQLLERRLSKLIDGERAKSLLEPIELVRGELSRLSRLVTEFLVFARPAALQARDTDLRDVLAQVVELERPVAHNRGVALELEAVAPVVVEADGERIKQIAFNLVRNAIEAAHTRVVLAVEADGAGARIHVRDDGPGIPHADLQRIFEPFFTTKESGTGLGMAIVHSLVERHGGSIEVSCNGGTTVTISLPRRVP